jgi:hypothetical protein
MRERGVERLLHSALRHVEKIFSFPQIYAAVALKKFGGEEIEMEEFRKSTRLAPRSQTIRISFPSSETFVNAYP